MNIFSTLATPLISSAGSALTGSNALIGTRADDAPAGPSFSQTLEKAFDNVNSLQNHADNLQKSFATGQTSDIHDVMIAVQQATIALQMTTQVRNKIIDAYQAVMQTSM